MDLTRASSDAVGARAVSQNYSGLCIDNRDLQIVESVTLSNDMIHTTANTVLVNSSNSSNEMFMEDILGRSPDDIEYNEAIVSPMVVCKSDLISTINGGNVVVKEYMCSVCCKVFKTSKDCKRHTIIHSGSKPYSCPYCDHTANLNFNLKKHIQKRHPDVPLEHSLISNIKK